MNERVLNEYCDILTFFSRQFLFYSSYVQANYILVTVKAKCYISLVKEYEEKGYSIYLQYSKYHSSLLVQAVLYISN